MNRKIPPDAFNYYCGLGHARSYGSVASHYKVTKRAVTKCAQRENWQERLATVERQARERSDRKAAESIEGMNSRHLSMMKYVQTKALEALRSMSLETAMEAVRALALCVAKEREIRGETALFTAAEIEADLRRQYEAFMVPNPSASVAGKDLGAPDAKGAA